MKAIFLFFTLTLSSSLFAQLKPAQSQYLIEKGFLINPGFEQGFSGWEISGTCSKSLVNEIPYLNKSLKITCVNQNFSVKQETIKQTQLQGQQGVYSAQIKASVNGLSIASLTGASRDNAKNIHSNSSFVRVSNIPYVVSSISNGIEIYSDSNITGEFIIDDVQLTLSSEGFIQQDFDDIPVGTILSYGSETLPSGYLLADGSCHSRATYASLFSVIGVSAGTCDSGAGANSGFNVPDLRNQFLRGLTAGRSVFDTQADATAVNGLSASTGTQSANHNHGDGLGFAGASGQTRFGLVNFGAAGGIMNDYGNQAFASTYSQYARTSDNLQSHTHSVSLSGDTETRPENKSVVYIIKAIGRNTQNIFSQKTTSPDKAGFIIWSAFDSNVEGHLKADGACVLKSSYPDYVKNVGTLYGECTINSLNDGVNLPDLVSQNRYVRGAGGSLAVGQLQDDATAVNGLSNVGVGDHTHVYSKSVTPGGGVQFNGGTLDNLANDNTSGAGAHNHAMNGDSETRPTSIALVPLVRMEDRDEIKGNFRNGARLGDCKYSILSHTHFNSENEGQWVRLEGQSIAGSDIDSKFGINSLPDAVSNGAFIRQVGGLSGSLRTFQDDKTSVNGLSTNTDGLHGHSLIVPSSAAVGDVVRNQYLSMGSGNFISGAGSISQNGSHNHSMNGDNETAPKNIALNFYCLVSK